MKSFASSKNEFGQVHVLTPNGIAKKLAIMHHLLRRKVEGYGALRDDINFLKSEVEKISH